MDTQTLIYIILFVFVILFAVILFLKTPKEERCFSCGLRKKRKTLEEELKSLTEEKEAVIVKAQRMKTFLHILPYILLFMPAIILGTFSEYIDTPLIICKEIQGVNLSIIIYAIAFYSLALGVFLYALELSYEGYRIYKYDFMPPLDAIRFQDFIAKKSKDSRIWAIMMMSLPILALILNIYSYTLLHNACDDYCQNKLHKKVLNECKKDITYKEQLFNGKKLYTL